MYSSNKLKALMMLLILAVPVGMCKEEQMTRSPEDAITTSQIRKQTVNHETEIVFGQTGVFTGHFKLYGELITKGIWAYFRRVNAAGGIRGRNLRLITVDDYGRPPVSEENIIKMMDELGIYMFLGNMGTRSVLKVLPMIQLQKIGMLFPWGGDEKLRDPALTHIVNGLGFIEPQINKLVDYVVNEMKVTKIGLFHADSSFGKANASYALKALETYGVKPVAVAEYNRHTMDIEPATAKLSKADPKVVLCLSSSSPASKVISNMFEEGHYGTRFLGIDSTLFVGRILKARGARFEYSSIVPDPTKAQITLAKQFYDDFRKYYPGEVPNVLSFAYYLNAAIVVKALESIDGEITKDTVIAAIENMKQTDIGGFTVNFNPQNRHAYPQKIHVIKG